MRWQAVVFDLDDTLYPERAYVLSGFRAVAAWAAREHGIDESFGFGELRKLFEAGVRGNTFDLWLAALGLPPGLSPELVRVYREHEPGLQLFDDADEVLRSLHRTVRLGLVSDGWSAVQRRKFHALGIERYFDAVVFSDELGGRAFWKPSRAPFEKVLADLDVSPRAAVYVADNCAKDFFGARAIGMSTVRIRREGGEYCDIEPSGPEWAADVTIASLIELRDLVHSAQP